MIVSELRQRVPWPYLIIFAIAAASPSSPNILRYLHWPGLLVYVVGVVAVAFFLPWIFRWILEHISQRSAMIVGIASFVALVAMYAILYPRANSTDPSRGTDRDEALNIAVRAMLAGKYPYYERTYLGFAPSPGPGALFLATPFVLLGNSPYQGFFWIPMFMFVAAKCLRDWRAPVLALWLLFLVSPAFLQEFVTGGDPVINTLYVITGILLLLMAAERNIWLGIGAAALLGVMLSSRATHLFALPPIFVVLCNRAGLKRATLLMCVAMLVLFAISYPFYLHDPKEFAPLSMQNKFRYFMHVLPHADAWATALVLLLTAASIAAMWRLRAKEPWPAFAATTVTLIFPALFGVALESIDKRGLSLTYAGFGSSATPYAVLAVVGALKRCVMHEE